MNLLDLLPVIPECLKKMWSFQADYEAWRSLIFAFERVFFNAGNICFQTDVFFTVYSLFENINKCSSFLI